VQHWNVTCALCRVFCSALQTNLRKPSALTSLDDLNARLLTLKTRLRQIEGWRDDTLKAADDPSAQTPREQYLEDAAYFQDRATKLRAEIAELEERRRLLRGH
jgi:hypothetical protein